MATEVLEAAGIGYYDTSNVVGGSDKVAAVNSPDDDSTYYIRHYRLDQSFLLATSGIPSGSTINSVTIHSRLATTEGTGGLYARTFLRLDGIDVESAIHYVDPGWYQWLSYDDILARPGGGSWTLSDLATLEMGVRYGVWNVWADCTTLYVVVDYTPPGAGATGNMLLMFH